MTKTFALTLIAAGLNLFGDQSLAVAVLPRLGISGGGLLTGTALQSTMNTDQGSLTNIVKSVTDKVPTLGSLGRSVTGLVTTTTVAQSADPSD